MLLLIIVNIRSFVKKNFKFFGNFLDFLNSFTHNIDIKPRRMTMNIIKKLRTEKNISQQKLAELCCVHQTAVSQWENGRTLPDRNSLTLLSRVFGVSVEVLLGIEKPKDENLIPGFERITAEAAEEKLGSVDFFALTVNDGSMAPTLILDDTVIISRRSEVRSGDIAAVAIGPSELSVKRVIKKGTSLMLVPENPAFEPMLFSEKEIESLPVSILGKAVELRRKF